MKAVGGLTGLKTKTYINPWAAFTACMCHGSGLLPGTAKPAGGGAGF